eukprot:2369393-Karenia_brevis.AAC.1
MEGTISNPGVFCIGDPTVCEKYVDGTRQVCDFLSNRPDAGPGAGPGEGAGEGPGAGPRAAAFADAGEGALAGADA